MNKTKIEDLKTESKIFDCISSEFVVNALFKFTCETFICFVMEYMNGGDFGHLLKSEQYLEENIAKFYISELILAVEYLHSIGIVHKDLKPENMLIDSIGHLKLTDFGLSDITLQTYTSNQKEIYSFLEKKHYALNKILKTTDKQMNLFSYKFEGENKSENTSPYKPAKKSINYSQKFRRFVGTPDYIAPEIILGNDVRGKAVDWWGVGVILFEFLTGVPPFNDDSPDKIFENVINLKIPWNDIDIGYEETQMTPEAVDLIKKLLVLDPEQRLGRNSSNEIKNHKFFEGFADFFIKKYKIWDNFLGIDWNNLRKMKAPIVPKKFDKEILLNELNQSTISGEKNLNNPFMNVQCDNQDKIKAETYIKGIETFSQVRFDLLYRENEKMMIETRYLFRNFSILFICFCIVWIWEIVKKNFKINKFFQFFKN